MTTNPDFHIKPRRAGGAMRHASIRFIGFSVSVPARPVADYAARPARPTLPLVAVSGWLAKTVLRATRDVFLG
jgi:hypothetical protein